MRVIKHRPTYTDEFRESAIELIRRGGRTYKQLGVDLGVSHWTLRDWYTKAEMTKKSKKGGKAAARAPQSEETMEQRLERLERENKALLKENESLKMDREILKKAAAFFAKESE
jgi:transposase